MGAIGMSQLPFSLKAQRFTRSFESQPPARALTQEAEVEEMSQGDEREAWLAEFMDVTSSTHHV